jgi:hypothetical protein
LIDTHNIKDIQVLLIRQFVLSISSKVSQSQLAVSNKKPRFGPKVATQAWWIEKIKEDPIYQYSEEWAKNTLNIR